MCRSIKLLFNFEPPATDEEIRASSIQFVRKLSGFNTPSKANEKAFHQAVSEVTIAARKLLDSLVTMRSRAIARSRPSALGAGCGEVWFLGSRPSALSRLTHTNSHGLASELGFRRIRYFNMHEPSSEIWPVWAMEAAIGWWYR